MRRAKGRVLVVEDDPDIREILVTLLREHGYAACGAASGLEAIEELRRRPADLVLLDLVMPVMNGWEFREEQLRDPALASIPFVVMSASSASAPELGASAWLSKPVRLRTVVETVERCVRRNGAARKGSTVACAPPSSPESLPASSRR